MKSVLKLFFLIAVCFAWSSVLLMAQSSSSDLEVALEVRLADNSGYIHGQYNVEVCIVKGVNSAAQDGCPDKSALQRFKNVTIINGFYSFIITQFNQTHFNVIDPYFLISLDPIDSSTDALITSFPVPSTPYAIHAMEADYAHEIEGLSVNAEFENITINGVLSVVNNDMTVFYVSQNVGVLTSDPEYPLDVNGKVNAASYLVDGQPLEEKFAWKRSGTDLYYNLGRVGIGREPGEYALDVSGNINAEAFYVSGNSLLKILSAGVWQKVIGKNDIYINLEEDAKIGIGVSENLNEMVEVAGAIRIGRAQRDSPVAGTIEFDNEDKDFYGYVYDQNQDVIRRSLTGVQFVQNPQPEQLLKWNSELKIVGIPTSDFTVSQNGFVGIGTSNPSALFTVVGKNDTAIMDVKYQQNGKSESAFFISEAGKIGVKTQNPNSDYDLDVNGALNATEIYVNGVDVASLTNQDLYWQPGSRESSNSESRIFYNRGYVGIGTDSPRNLLEISNLTSTGNAAITFDLDNDDKFTIGIQGDQEDVTDCNSNVSESFVFSTGSDLKTPILSFNQDRIGIGIDCPKATFHVQSDTGFLVEGTYSEAFDSEFLELSGSYMYFYPKRAAFRAGTFQANQGVGSFSVAFGRNNEASGKGSVVVGGSDNKATGDHSSVLGGHNNIAGGDGSVALGQYACANHSGSFVWNSQFYNTDTAADCFSTSRAYQFLINAQGGVGIGTPTTNLSALTVKMNSEQQDYIASFYGINSNENVNIYKTGLVGIGLLDSDYSGLDSSLKLAVKGNVMVGPPINSQSLMTINHDPSQSDVNHVFSVYTNTLKPAFVINTDGNIGVGGIDPSFQLHVSGNVYAKRVLYKTNDGYRLLESSTSPWRSDDDYNIYRSTGKVGIGTDAPSSLLTLSGAKPELSFVNDDSSEGFAMGIITPNNTFMIQALPTLNTAVRAPLMITQNKVGMGLFIDDVPEATLHVSGDMYVQGSIGIATTNFTYPLNVGGIASFETLFVNGEVITPTISPWQSNSDGNFIYVTPNVGVLIGGTESSQMGNYMFRVLGNAGIDRVSANALEALNVAVDRISFKSDSSTNSYLHLNNGELEFCSANDCKQIFEGLQYSEQLNASGPLAFWSADDTISRLPAFWNADVNQLSLTGNMSIQSYRNNENDIYITSNIHIGNGNNAAFEMNLSLDHGAIVNNGFVNSFYASKIGVHLQNYWNSAVDKNLVGLDISMTKADDAALVASANVIGLQVDVTDLNGLSAAAVFNGGPILITDGGISQPDSDVLLHVNGGIQADAINIDDGLSLTGDLEVYSGDREVFVVKEESTTNLPYIAVGGATPNSRIMLNVSGSVQVRDIEVSDRIEAAALQVGDEGVVVSTDGRVGFGALPSNPFTQVYISNRVSINQGVTHVAEKVDVDLSFSNDDSSIYTFRDSVTAMDIDIRNSREGGANIAGTLVGMDVAISQNVGCEANCDIVGLNVNVGNIDTLNPNRISAVFTGGGVGIGKVPSAGMMLDVSGNISVKGIAFDALQLDQLTANRLIVNNAEFETLQSNQIYANNIEFDALNINGSIALSQLTLSTLNVTRQATFNAFSASNATFDDLNVTTFTVSEINADMPSGLTINANVNVNGTLDVGNVQLGNVRFDAFQNQALIPGDVSNMLYVLNNDLYFETTNLTSFFTGVTNSIAVVNGEGSFVSTPLKYEEQDTLSKFILDGMSTPSPTLFKVSGNINLTSDFIAHHMHLKLTSSSNDNRFTGMAIQIDSDVNPQGQNYELGDNEEAVGLKVDLTGLPSGTNATKNAALFYGGNVGVGTQAPTALLHIQQENSETPLFNIEDSQGNTMFKINHTGQVGINAEPDDSAQLLIQGSDDLLKVGIDALVVNQSGKVGIGSSPNLDYQLFVNGNMNVSDMLYVTGNQVSIGDLPIDDSTFYVAGSSVFNEVQASTANITSSLITNGSLIVSKNYADENSVSGFDIQLLLAEDSAEAQQVTGLDINLSSDDCGSSNNKCTIQNGNIYGLYVNLDDLGVPISQDSVTLNSAVFLGGNVGIGTDEPNYPLHIQSSSNLSDLIGFTYSNDSNPVTLRFQSFSNDSGSFIGVALGDDRNVTNRIIAFSSQKMIINYTSEMDTRALNSSELGSLVVNGSLQIGAKDRESKLYLGDAYFQLTTNNTLKLVIPTSNSDQQKSRFSIGAQIDNTFTPFFSINSSGNVAILGRGGSNLSDLDSNDYLLYVANSASASNEEPVVVFHNVKNLPVTTLLEMRISADNTISPSENYIVFSKSNGDDLQYLGAIEGNDDGGVQYTTGGADYAEYLEKMDVNETIEKGDIVGVLNGKISKKTDGAQHVLVRSSSAAVAGNWPGDNLNQFSLIAFMGQVLVKVNGPVKLGDFIIPSGRQDGTGIAIPEDQLTLAQQAMIVGRAWSSSDEISEKLVLCAVGIQFSAPNFSAEIANLQRLEKQVNALSEENKSLSQQLDRLSEQEVQIQSIIDRFK